MIVVAITFFSATPPHKKARAAIDVAFFFSATPMSQIYFHIVLIFRSLKREAMSKANYPMQVLIEGLIKPSKVVKQSLRSFIGL